MFEEQSLVSFLLRKKALSSGGTRYLGSSALLWEHDHDPIEHESPSFLFGQISFRIAYAGIFRKFGVMLYVYHGPFRVKRQLATGSRHMDSGILEVRRQMMPRTPLMKTHRQSQKIKTIASLR